MLVDVVVPARQYPRHRHVWIRISSKVLLALALFSSSSIVRIRVSGWQGLVAGTQLARRGSFEASCG